MRLIVFSAVEDDEEEDDSDDLEEESDDDEPGLEYLHKENLSVRSPSYLNYFRV